MALDIGQRTFEDQVRRAKVDGRPLPRVAIIGAGFSGLAAAIQLARSGVRSFTIIEQSDGVGGTWRDNTYPGAACDVPSHLYSLSFAPKTDWSRRFAEQPEILAYAEELVDRFHLGPHLRLSTSVDQLSFDEASETWRLAVTGSEGPETITADTVFIGCGQLNRPYLPDIDGRDTFSGPAFHSARWDHSTDLAGKRVGVVGSGASAIQFVPEVAAQAASTTIFQRSPNYVGPKKDHPYRATTRTVLNNVRPIQRAYRAWIYVSLESRWLWLKKDSLAGRKLREMFTKGIRDGVVSDRLPDAAVVPDYPIGCKRILISNDWYPTLLRPDVAVVDEAIIGIEPDAVITADGARHDVDVLIYGTGFETTNFLSHLPVTGVGGASLADAWADGAHAYLGLTVAGFPNCYLLYGPNTNLGHNSILFMIERQLNLALQAVALQVAAGSVGTTVAVGEGAYRRDDERTQHLVQNTAWAGSCTSWYKSASGRITNNWPTWTIRYWWETLRIRPTDFDVVAASPEHTAA